jgi:long-chain acyl-CoA synthetase
MPLLEHTPKGATDLMAAIMSVARRKPAPIRIDGESLALPLYTSGTTGVPKGALARHSALTFNGAALGQWCALHTGSRILAIAPLFHITLFHITGIVCHIVAAFFLVAE